MPMNTMEDTLQDFQVEIKKKYYVRIRAYRSYKTKEGKKKKEYGKWIVKLGKIIEKKGMLH